MKKKNKDFLDGMGIEPRNYNDYNFLAEGELLDMLDSDVLSSIFDFQSDKKLEEKLDRRVLLMLM